MNKLLLSAFFAGVFTGLAFSSENSSGEDTTVETKEKYHFSKKVNYGEGNKPLSITITEENFQANYEIPKERIMKTIQKSGKLRKQKQLESVKSSPLISHKTIPFTSTVGGKPMTEDLSVYEINNKEDKRKSRELVQKIHDDSKKAYKEKTDKPEAIVIQRGPDEKTDMTILRSGYDIAAAPLWKSGKDGEGYRATKPPAYGTAVSESSKSFQKTLKVVEGCRSTTASTLRHIAKKDEDFIGKAKGGAKKLRNYDESKATKVDEEKVLDSFYDIFIIIAKTKEILPSLEVFMEDIERELGTETDSPSFIKSAGLLRSMMENDIRNLSSYGEFSEFLQEIEGDDELICVLMDEFVSMGIFTPEDYLDFYKKLKKASTEVKSLKEYWDEVAKQYCSDNPEAEIDFAQQLYEEGLTEEAKYIFLEIKTDDLKDNPDASKKYLDLGPRLT